MDSPAPVATGAKTKRVRRIFACPIGWPTGLIVGALAAFTLWAFSVPGGPSMGILASLVLAWFAVGPFWLARLLLASFAGGFHSLREAWVRWSVPPLIVVITAALLMTSAPLLMRFNLSQDAMDQLARDAQAGPEAPNIDRVGLFPAQEVETFDGGVRFLVDECMVDMCGFAYSSKGRPPNLSGEDSYYHLEGRWYLWEESW